jgi:hypothetical protein
MIICIYRFGIATIHKTKSLFACSPVKCRRANQMFWTARVEQAAESPPEKSAHWRLRRREMADIGSLMTGSRITI